jgi:D-arginine dehydrogenase
VREVDVDDLPASADVVVVGGGIAGAAAGHFLAGAGAHVLLLEQEPVLAHHTTGRSAAQFLGHYGGPAVRRLTRASRPFLESPPDGLVDVPLLSPRSALEVGGPDDRDALAEYVRGGEGVVPGIRLLSVDEAVEVCPVLRPEALGGAVLEPEAMDIDVMALHQGFVRGLRRAGGSIRSRAAVSGIDRTPGGDWQVWTGGGRVRTRLLVDAAGAWGDRVAVMAGVRPVALRPLRRTAFTVGLPGPMTARGWPLVHDHHERWYFKPEGDGLLCSLADEAPDVPSDPRPRDEDVALAIERINAATSLGLRHVRRAWAGLRTFAPDRVPVIGPDPDHPRFVWAAGLGGFGIQTAPGLGMLVAATALGAHHADLVGGSVDARDFAPGRLR